MWKKPDGQTEGSPTLLMALVTEPPNATSAACAGIAQQISASGKMPRITLFTFILRLQFCFLGGSIRLRHDVEIEGSVCDDHPLMIL